MSGPVVRSPSKCLTATRDTAHETVAELAAASGVVALCLSEDSDTVEVADRDGWLRSMHHGAVLVNHGTGLPQAARELAQLAAAHGADVVDAPVSGGHAVAVARQLTTMVGGDQSAMERVTPVFETDSRPWQRPLAPGRTAASAEDRTGR
ncbi:NAD(P)-binding domain-containing protein [Streptomyces phaeochromogenes]